MVTQRWFLGSVACLAIAGAAIQPYRPIVVVGKSMTPTYGSGELLWTTPIDRPLRHGDVVVADGPEGPVIKRVALLPGDQRTQWRNPNGWLDMTTFDPPKKPRSQKRVRGCAVPPGMVYLLGDDLDVSLDSRTFGPVPLEKVRRLVLDLRDPDPKSAIAREAPRRWIVQGIQAGQRHWAARNRQGQATGS